MAEAYESNSSSTFRGTGSVSRNERLTLRIAATVVEELPNGVLRIEGQQEVRVNYELRELIAEVKAGRMSRRGFIHTMVGLGLTAPLATQMLAHSGLALAQPASTYKPTRRGGGGPLRLLWWQGATLLNPHFAVGTKDQEGSRVFYEPLAAWDPDGNLIPVLAAEIPSVDNGGLARDGMSVVWKLKKGVQWHDGAPFSADDVLFTWEFAADPATAATTSGSYKEIKVEKVDSHAVRVRFSKPTPYWADPFVGTVGMIIPKHLFDKFRGAKSREAPTNLKPVGTGPYRFADFKPGDMVRGTLNPGYHLPNRPYFDTIEMKGGGDAVSAARAVLQTGEFDYAWNMQVEDEILKRMEAGGKGRADLAAHIADAVLVLIDVLAKAARRLGLVAQPVEPAANHGLDLGVRCAGDVQGVFRLAAGVTDGCRRALVAVEKDRSKPVLVRDGDRSGGLPALAWLSHRVTSAASG